MADASNIEFHLDDLLAEMETRKASDLHLKVGRPPLYRINGELTSLGVKKLTAEEMDALVAMALDQSQIRLFRRMKSLDIGRRIEGVGRFRINFYQAQGYPGIVARRISFTIPRLDELELPDSLRTFANAQQGLVLVTGPTGSGKSSTLAAIIQEINTNRRVNIITIEDPVEFVFQDALASINQREVGMDTPDFTAALRVLLRQDPDVIMVGEIRDLETLRTVLTAAETGHLVFSTLHTNDAAQTINRIISMYPKSSKPFILSQLSTSLLAIVSQRLVKRAEGKGRVAAVEVLKNSPIISKQIREGAISEILPKMEEAVVYERMQSLNQSLCALWANNAITEATAMTASPNPDELSQMYNKMFFLERRRREECGESGEFGSYSDRLEELSRLRVLWARQEALHQEENEVQEREHKQLLEEREWLKEDYTRVKSQTESARNDYDRLERELKAKVEDLDATIRDLEIQISKGKRAMQLAANDPLKRK